MRSNGVDQNITTVSEQTKGLGTEQRNPATLDLDQMTVRQILEVMSAEDTRTTDAVRSALPSIEQAVEAIVHARSREGRLIYLGAGTSGRLGLLDAVECPPTFGVSDQEVIGLMAGGPDSLVRAAEGAEDDQNMAAEDLRRISLSQRDVVVGLSASGRTPYVIGGLDHARKVGATTIAVSCNPGAVASRHADIAVELPTGPEVLTGSTRLKAGTATKMVCNMLSTATMVRTGKVFQNLMVDLRPTNEKLVARACRIVSEAAGVAPQRSAAALQEADLNAKVAIVMLVCGCDRASAVSRLARASGHTREAIIL